MKTPILITSAELRQLICLFYYGVIKEFKLFDIFRKIVLAGIRFLYIRIDYHKYHVFT